MSKDNTTSNGVSFLGLLTLAFIILKLCHVINWSWWYVLMPFYLPILIGLIIFVFFLLRAIKQ